MTISVVLALYNGRSFISEQLQSIYMQTKPVSEIIILDDCSTFKSKDLVLSSDTPPGISIRYYENDINIGYAQTFFRALSYAKGDYIFFADQDDIWEKYKVERMIKIMKSDKRILCLSSLNKIIDAKGNYLKKEKKFGKRYISEVKWVDVLKQKCLRPGMSLLIDDKLKSLVFENDITGYKQHDRFIEYIAAYNGGFFVLNEYLNRYRIHSNNTSGLNLTFRLRTNIEGRIAQIDVEVQYLRELLKTSCSNKLVGNNIEELIQFYEIRKDKLMRSNISYFFWGLLHLNKYAKPKVWIGDVIAKLKGV